MSGQITPANRADTVELDLPPETIGLADKGYSSRKNREMLKRRGFYDGIMEGAVPKAFSKPSRRAKS